MSTGSTNAGLSRRWLAPIAAVAVAVAAPFIASTAAQAEPNLPPITPQQLLADVLSAKPVALQGEVSQQTNLGLPDVSQIAGSKVSLTSPASLLNLASGTHSYRVWTDGAHAFKVALTDPSAETSITTDGTQVWVWSSTDNTVWHATPSPQAGPPARPTPPPTPDEIAQHILTSIEPTTTVTTASNATVAGRPAYTLLLTPQDAAARIGSIAINVDAATKLPVAVHVTARGATDPALSVAFTTLKLGAPAQGTFTFTPPAGAAVKELPAEQPPIMHPGSAGQPGTTQPGAKEPASSGATQPVITGTGWSAVAVWQAPSSLTGSAGSTSPAGLLKSLPRVSGTWGSGYLISSTLGSAVLTDDGRIAVGAVGPDQLYSALAR